MLSIIVAVDKQLGIGQKGWMPWDLPEDLKLFKKVTLNKTLIMGNETFKGLKAPLVKRKTIVLTSNPLFQNNYENVFFTNDFESLILKYENSEEEVFVSGGTKIYNLFLPYCQRLYISHVNGEYLADTYFPEFNEFDYNVVFQEDYQQFTYKIYEKKEGK